MKEEALKLADELLESPFGWVDDIGTFVTASDYQELHEKLREGMLPLYISPHHSSDVKQTKPLKRLNKQEIARYMFSQNTGQDIGQALIEYFCDKNCLTLEYIED